MKMRDIEVADLVPGAVIRMTNNFEGNISIQPWSDCIVEKVENGIVYSARPHAAVVNGSFEVFSERFSAPIERYLRKDHWQLVTSERGRSLNYAR